MITIGIPRALLYYDCKIAWSAMFHSLGAGTVITPPTNRDIFQAGLQVSSGELCLPCKVYLGHVLYLQNRVEYLWAPRIRGLGKGECMCPFLWALPELIRHTVPKAPPLISPTIQYKQNPLQNLYQMLKGGQQGPYSSFTLYRAFQQAMETQRIHERSTLNKQRRKDYSKEKPALAVFGHTYFLQDGYSSGYILREIEERGWEPMIAGNFSQGHEIGCKSGEKKMFWTMNQKNWEGAQYLLQKNLVAGVLLLSSFACGPDSLIHFLWAWDTKYPVLALNLDEHTEKEGLLTRLEAFLDMLERREAVADHLPPSGAVTYRGGGSFFPSGTANYSPASHKT